MVLLLLLLLVLVLVLLLLYCCFVVVVIVANIVPVAVAFLRLFSILSILQNRGSHGCSTPISDWHQRRAGNTNATITHERYCDVPHILITIQFAATVPN